MIIDVEAPIEIETLVAVLSLGLCTALESQSLTIEEASGCLFSPYTMSLLRRVNASPDLVHLIHLGTELEDLESFTPNYFLRWLETMKVLALAILRSPPELSEHEYKEHWFQDNPRLVPVPLPDPLQKYPPDGTVTRDEKLYRMLMTAHDEHGDPFWGFLQELFSINYWNNSIPEDQADAVYRATIPEAQSLLRELYHRGFVFISRQYGYPPPSSRQFKVTEEEAEYVMADPQNWLGPELEGPAATCYHFCSNVPGETISRETITNLREKQP